MGVEGAQKKKKLACWVLQQVLHHLLLLHLRKEVGWKEECLVQEPVLDAFDRCTHTCTSLTV